MIGANINCKLSGIHFSAFYAFCNRFGIKITKYGILRLIEMLPEYKQLTNLPDVAPDNNTNENVSQGQIT